MKQLFPALLETTTTGPWQSTRATSLRVPKRAILTRENAVARRPALAPCSESLSRDRQDAPWDSRIFNQRPIPRERAALDGKGVDLSDDRQGDASTH